MRINKIIDKTRIIKPYLKILIILILPIISLYYISQKFFKEVDIISKTVLLSSSIENPAQTLSNIKNKFEDIISTENKETPQIDLNTDLNNDQVINYKENINKNPENIDNTSNENSQTNLIDNTIETRSTNEAEEIIEFVPEEYRGKIIEEHFKGGSEPIYIDIKPGYLSNRTKINSETLKNKINKMQDIKLSLDNQPQVLLFSTHATESFEPCDREFYDKRYNSRSTDNNKNVTQVEDKIAQQLTANGINTIVDKTQHDFPSYNGSYNRSAVTIENYLKRYPSIKVVLDIHRDAIERDNGERVKPVVTINGKKAAQIMIISGCDDGTMNFPNWEQNLNFAVSLQKQAENSYPGLMRPIFFCYRKYNMNLCPCSLLIEFGSNSNSLNEVMYSGELMGKALSDLLLADKS